MFPVWNTPLCAACVYDTPEPMTVPNFLCACSSSCILFPPHPPLPESAIFYHTKSESHQWDPESEIGQHLEPGSRDLMAG